MSVFVSFTKRVLLGASIASGVTTLMGNNFNEYHLIPHNGNPNAKQDFNDKFSMILNKHQWKPYIYGIIGINTCVFLLWRGIPEIMSKHFLVNIDNIAAKR